MVGGLKGWYLSMSVHCKLACTCCKLFLVVCLRKMEKETVDQLLQGMKQLQEEMKIVRQGQEETALRLGRSAGRKEPYMSKKRGNELQPGSISKQLVADKMATAMACVEN